VPAVRPAAPSGGLDRLPRMTPPEPTRSRHVRTPQGAAIAAFLALAIAGCAAAGPTPSPALPSVTTSGPLASAEAPTEAPPEPPTDEEVRAAMQARQELGLRADEGWVREVAMNPDAVMDWGVPLLPFEAAQLSDRPTGDDVVTTTVREYLDAHADISGGLYIDQARGGVVTALVTTDPTAHELAIRALLDGPAPVAVRQVRWTEAELDALQERIGNDQAFLAGLPARMTTSSVDIIGNRVELSISSAVPDAAERIATHLGTPQGQLTVHSDGTGLLLQPTGRIVGRIIAPAGTDMSAFSPQYEADVDIGVRDAMGIAVAPDGTFTIDDLPPTGYTVTILELGGAGNREVGSARAIVPPGGVVAVEIPVTP
jgi:hypothetical protein